MELEESKTGEILRKAFAGELRANASNINLEQFAVDDAAIRLSGASNGTINASGTLDANVSGASSLYYVGNPTLGDIDTSGASKVREK